MRRDTYIIPPGQVPESLTVPDRRVHAFRHDVDLVRYERAGKWFIEPRCEDLPRQHVTIDAAALYALWLWKNGGEVRFGVPGGSTFDRKLHDLVT